MPTAVRYLPSAECLLSNSIGWALSVFGVGALITLVAAWGYDTVVRVANIAAPWMVLVFLAFGPIGLRQFVEANGTDIHSFSDLWALCSNVVWKGRDPLPGQIKFTFWHVTFFAWFCNMAMHVGMSDLSVLRFARKSWYGIASAGGMYVGHFMAWLSASVLYALQLHAGPANANVLPGPMAFQAAGLTGLLCVVVAGWTTANPTIYRAGLATLVVAPGLHYLGRLTLGGDDSGTQHRHYSLVRNRPTTPPARALLLRTRINSDIEENFDTAWTDAPYSSLWGLLKSGFSD